MYKVCKSWKNKYIVQGEPSESITSNNSFRWPGIEKSFI